MRSILKLCRNHNARKHGYRSLCNMTLSIYALWRQESPWRLAINNLLTNDQFLYDDDTILFIFHSHRLQRAEMAEREQLQAVRRGVPDRTASGRQETQVRYEDQIGNQFTEIQRSVRVVSVTQPTFLAPKNIRRIRECNALRALRLEG